MPTYLDFPLLCRWKLRWSRSSEKVFDDPGASPRATAYSLHDAYNSLAADLCAGPHSHSSSIQRPNTSSLSKYSSVASLHHVRQDEAILEPIYTALNHPFQ